ncbi:MAG: DNA-formamidopyrimidine glycosylase family protein [Pseudomonadales bacterium]|jgi:formamidopyrimidine-DNA glycosylase
MPELPDLTVYLERIEERVLGERLTAIRLASPFLLRTVQPSVDEVSGRRLVGSRRLAKQLVLCLEDDYFLVLHLMISGRLQWMAPEGRIPKRNGLAAFDFESGSLLFTEASKKKRASLKLVHGQTDLDALDPGGLEVLEIDLAAFRERLLASNHTLKRALTDQHVFAGIGNAYSDEILLRAGLSPFKRAANLGDAEMAGLFEACRDVLGEWTERLREQSAGRWPTRVTAFHPEMAVHGKYREPCPVCGSPVQRIVYAENEANYCARCQTGGRLLADRSLSRLLKDNWPKRLEDLE